MKIEAVGLRLNSARSIPTYDLELVLYKGEYCWKMHHIFSFHRFNHTAIKGAKKACKQFKITEIALIEGKTIECCYIYSWDGYRQELNWNLPLLYDMMIPEKYVVTIPYDTPDNDIRDLNENW